MAVVAFRILICLFFLDICNITIGSVSDVSRVTRGLAIRRAKKRVNLTNDKRIKMCLQRFDSHAYTWRCQYADDCIS